ncbi:MAG: VWA domain-containing protein, partial [Myxococcales bacterium]|nr:VWA domain-containing protein [Myxococcales bacterium]
RVAEDMMRRLGQGSFGLLALALVACGGSKALEAPKAASPALESPAPMAPPSDESAGAVAYEERDEASEAPAPPADATPSGAAYAPAKASAGDRAEKRSSVASSGRRRPGGSLAQAGGVKAGEWDDNANYREFQRWISSQSGLGFDSVNVSKRRFIVVTDSQGKAVPGCRVSVTDGAQRSVQLTTQTSGRSLLFPAAEGLQGNSLVATTTCQGRRAAKRFDLAQEDGVVTLKLDTTRKLPATRTIDIAFVLDSTGSMSEEIASVKETIRAVAKQLDTGNVNVRIGMVDFKDRTDNYVTKVRRFTTDLGSFAQSVESVQASGGGDTPESVNEGLRVALSQLDWSDQSVGRFAFLIGDAPPHLDYQDTSYSQSMKRANHSGIQVFTIAASGMDGLGQAVWRQIAQYTGGTNMFVLRGGAGPQSTGAGDAKSSCGGTHTNYASGNLDTLIVQKVQRELRALDSNPMRIAGLGQDERAKPCSERLVMAN